MNSKCYRLVFSHAKHMMVAVPEFASGDGGQQSDARCASVAAGASVSKVRLMAFAVMLALGTASSGALAQIVTAPGSGAHVVQTQNGLPQVDIAKPSGAGVSLNKYSQFDVTSKGAILNNSPTIVQTQLAGMINGNANLTPGHGAKVIVNQVMSNAPSQLRGYVEVAGQKAEVVIANPNGLAVDGAGFINTSRAVLTTGTPTFGPGGELAGFSITGGNISVQGAGMNVANVDQVDLLARAVQANAKIYANQLNVVAGANQVDHGTLAATQMAGDGHAPSVAIDVGQLGGMYANRIFLASNEFGVGVASHGELAAKAGDMTLNSQGTLTLAGTTSASGNIKASARDGIDNSGTTYARQDMVATTTGALNNSGALAAQHDVTVNAGHVSSSGTLGAGVNDEGSVVDAGNLAVSTTGALSMRGSSVAGGNATLQGAAIDLQGSHTSANGALALAATNGDINLSRSATVSGGALNATTKGALINQDGKLSSGGAMQIDAARVNNANGQLASQASLDLNSAGALDNRQGTVQAGGRANMRAGEVDNTGGRILSLNADGLTLGVAGALDNGKDGVIGSNGALDIAAGAITNQGRISAAANASVRAQSIDNHTGSIIAGGRLNATSGGALNNAQGTLSGESATIAASSIDNTAGAIDGQSLELSSAGDLVNRSGSITQYGAGNQSIKAGGALDNTGGTVASNAASLAIQVRSIGNDGGKIQHAGNGELSLKASGAISNAAGNAQTNGSLSVTGASVDNTSGTLLAMRGARVDSASNMVNRHGSIYGGDSLTLSAQGDIDNSDGSTQTAGDLSVDASGALINTQGTLSANGEHGAVDVHAARVDNTRGKLTNAGDGATGITATDVTNTSGTLGGNGDLTVNAQTLSNDAGANLVAGGAANLNVSQYVNNAGGTLFGGKALKLDQAGATVINDGGAILGGGDVSMNVAALSNQRGAIRANRNLDASGAVSGSGDMVAGGHLGLAVYGDYLNDAANNLHADGDMSLSVTGRLINAGTLAAHGALTVAGQNIVNTAAGDINSANTNVSAAGAINNDGRIEGDIVDTHSAIFANTGTVIGNDVTIHASVVTNSGDAAAIAGANSVHVYADNSVINRDGALIYSVGNLEIARDGSRDAGGMLVNQTNSVVNSAANIEADGDIDIAAHTVRNERVGMVIEAGVPVDAGTSTLTLWTAGIGVGDLGTYHSKMFPEWNWTDGAIGFAAIGALMKPITATVPKDQVTNLDSAAQTFSLTRPLVDVFTDFTHMTEVCNNNGFCHQEPAVQTRNVATNATQWYSGFVDNGDGTVSITFWPDFDPNRNIRPDDVKIDTSLGKNGHDYVEISRTVHTTTTTDRLIDAGTGAMMQAQGSIRINADGGTINNVSSTMAAGGNLVRRATNETVADTGTVLQQIIRQKSTSDYYWHQKTGSDSDTKPGIASGISETKVPVGALPGIGTANGTVQTNAATININAVDRQGKTVIGSGVTGGSADGTITRAANGQSKAPQTLSGTSGGIPNLKLPVNGLYRYNEAPEAAYLVVTDPRLTSYSSFISSDYMLNALGLDPQKTIKRVGDGAYEQTLVRNQITQLTGRTFLSGYSDAMGEYTALMNNGVAYAGQFKLTPGIALTAEQMAQLTTDMVWLVAQDVTLPNGSHQTVMVPQVYLAQANAVDLNGSGALVAGNAVNLKATGDVNNSGHVTSNLATVIIGNNVSNSGVIGSAGATAVVAVQDVRNTSGRIGGADVLVQAGRDVINETRTYRVSEAFASNGVTGRVTGTGVDALGTISATNNAVVIAGRDVNVSGAVVQAGGNAAVIAARDLNIGTTEFASSRDVHTRDRKNGSHDEVTQQLGSAIVAGGNVATASGRDTTLTGSAVVAGSSASMLAGGNLTITAAKDTATHQEQSLGGKQVQYSRSSYDEQVSGASVTAGANVVLAAGQNGSGNLAVMGSNVTAQQGGVALISAGDITIGSISETHDSQSWSHKESSGFLSKTTTKDTASSHQTISNGSTISGDTVSGVAGRDMTIRGSTVAASNDVSLAAAHDLIIDTAQDTSQSSSFHQEVHTGLGSSGGVGFSYGRNEQKDSFNDASVTNRASLVGSAGGNVSLSAGNDLHVRGSDLIAAKNLTGVGANVTIESAVDSVHHDETHEVKTAGVSLAVKSPVIDAVLDTVTQAKAAGNSQDGRAATLHGIAAASSAAAAAGAGGAAADAMANGQLPEVKAELSFGASHSKSTFNENSTSNRGSNVTAGGTAAFVATGSGEPGSGNVTIAGSNVNANDVILAAKNQVNLINTTDTDATRSSNQSSSAGAGVSFGTKGWGVSASMAMAHGDGNSDAARQNNTHIKANNTATIISGGDTNIIGANVSGRQVNANVGGNLNIASVQDTMNSASHQTSTSGGFSISQAGGGGNFSHTNAKANGSYAGVNEQAGISAGEGGFNINVKGNTDLKGAVIASAAEASKNRLTTGTLTFSDIENRSEYSASSSGFAASATTQGRAGGMPMLAQNESGSDRATTRTAISEGAITITDAAHQTQDIASLSRDTSNTNGTVAKLPDVNNLIVQQADMMSAASAAGAAVAQRIGDYADAKYKEAEKAGDAEGMAQWKEGGLTRAGMQAAGAAIVTGLGGGDAIVGAAGAGITSWSADKLNDVSGAIADANPTGNAELNRALGNAVANGLVLVTTEAVGGNAGSFAGSNVDAFNRQLHPDERQWIKDNAGRYAKQYAVSVDQAISELTTQANLQVQNGSAGSPNANAEMFLRQAHGLLPADGNSGPGYMFQATEAQRADVNMYSHYYADGEGLNVPSKEDVQRVTDYRQGVNNKMAGGTIAAFTGASAIVAAPAALAAGAVESAALGGTISGAMDAAAQYSQGGTIRPGQTAFAATVGAISGPIGSELSFIGNTVLAGAGSATTTAFNNARYGENTSLVHAFSVGSLFGSTSYAAGLGTTKLAEYALPATVFSKNLNPAIPALFQGSTNAMPARIGAGTGGVIGGMGSFVPGKDADALKR
jgi:filamentous hemagglutinin